MIARRAMMGLLGDSGGGGGDVTDRLVLVHEERLGHIQYANTSAQSLNKTVVVNNIDYDLYLVCISRDTIPSDNYHISTIRPFFVYGSVDATERASSVFTGSQVEIFKSNDSSGTIISRSMSTLYGIFPNSCKISKNDGTITMNIYACYNSSYTGTINGNYTCRVYGINLYDLLGG